MFFAQDKNQRNELDHGGDSFSGAPTRCSKDWGPAKFHGAASRWYSMIWPNNLPRAKGRKCLETLWQPLAQEDKRTWEKTTHCQTLYTSASPSRPPCILSFTGASCRKLPKHQVTHFSFWHGAICYISNESQQHLLKDWTKQSNPMMYQRLD